MANISYFSNFITGNGGGRQAPGSFIFSLRNKENLSPFKAELKDQNDQSAITASSHLCSVFGGGNDIYIPNNAAESMIMTNFGVSYQAPSAVKSASAVLAGSYQSTPSEIEVFYLE